MSWYVFYGPEYINWLRSEYVQGLMKKDRQIRSKVLQALDAFDLKARCTDNEVMSCGVMSYRFAVARRAPIKAVEKQVGRLHALRAKVDGTIKPPDRASFKSDILFVQGVRSWLQVVPPMDLKVNCVPC